MDRALTRRRFLLGLGGTAAAATTVGRLRPSRDADPDVAPSFRHERIDPAPPSPSLGFIETGDLSGSGRADLVVAGKGPRTNLWFFGTRTGLPSTADVRYRFGLGDPTVFWYENPGWQRHAIASVPHIAEGGDLGDVTGSGTLDLVIGQSLRYRNLFWFEQPADPRTTWDRHLITDDFEMYHDIAVADVDDDGEPEVVAMSYQSGVLFYYDIPDDPRQSPWPRSNRHLVMTGTQTKGLAVLDIDGDGRTEIVAGNSIYHRRDDGWSRERFTTGYVQPRIQAADLDGDGDLELVLAEGDSPWVGNRPGRLTWFDPPTWEPHVLRSDLFCPHSLAVEDFDGDGQPDILVAEMGLGRNDDPAVYCFRNSGDASFDARVVSRGIPTHEATAADLDGDGLPDLAGKSYRPENHVDVWYNRSRSG